MPSWIIFGRGALGNALKARIGDNALQLAAREWLDNPTGFSSQTKALFLAIPDDEIIFSVKKIMKQNITIPIFHCSGITPLSDISFYPNSGIWYPMQSFKSNSISWSDMPVFWETKNNFLKTVLEMFHKDLQIPNGLICTSEMRGKYHLGAVFANNFMNHQIGLIKEYCSINGIDVNFFNNMILKTIKTALDGKPFEIQTGPAYRGDKATIEKHLEILPDDMRKIYKSISDNIAEIKLKESEL